MLLATETLTTGLSWAAIGVLVSPMLLIGGALIGYAMRISSRVATVIAKLAELGKALDRLWNDYREVDRQLDRHEVQLTEHGQRIEVLERSN